MGYEAPMVVDELALLAGECGIHARLSREWEGGRSSVVGSTEAVPLYDLDLSGRRLVGWLCGRD